MWGKVLVQLVVARAACNIKGDDLVIKYLSQSHTMFMVCVRAISFKMGVGGCGGWGI